MAGERAIAKKLTKVGLTFGALTLAAGLPSAVLAQDAVQDATPNQDREISRDESAFVNQAPEDASSKVYFPEEITPQSVAAARARAAQLQQIKAQEAANRSQTVTQLPSQGGGNDVAQLSSGPSSAALAQLSAAERQVLLDAVEGTDICDRESDIAALKALCEGRIETRSAEFARNETGSAEDQLLGGGLDAGRVATLQAAIARLAGINASPSNFDNQVVASVALNNQSLNEAQATAADGDPTAGLSQETQAVVSAIVQQLGGGN